MFVVTCSEDRSFKVWDWSTRCLCYQSGILSAFPLCAVDAEHSSGRIVVGSEDGKVFPTPPHPLSLPCSYPFIECCKCVDQPLVVLPLRPRVPRSEYSSSTSTLDTARSYTPWTQRCSSVVVIFENSRNGETKHLQKMVGTTELFSRGQVWRRSC